MTTHSIAFPLLVILALLLGAATVFEQWFGADWSARWFYGAPWTIALWALCATSALVYVVKRRRSMTVGGFMIHVALAVILAGAAVTHFTALDAAIVLEQGAGPTGCLTGPDGRPSGKCLPFNVSLVESRIEVYPATDTPMDYLSRIVITAPSGNELASGTVSMNRPLDYDGYRFFQTSLWEGHSLLTVSHDPWGTPVTYCGYALLLLAIVACALDRRGPWCRLLRQCAAAGATLAIVFSTSFTAQGAELPKSVQPAVAERLGSVLVYYNDRVCPLETMSRDICLKITGAPSYRGLSANQVVAGLLFRYDSWVNEPMIEIKSNTARRILGISGNRASLADFDNGSAAELNEAARSNLNDRALRDDIEKAALMGRIATGAAFKIYPWTNPGSGHIEWVSWVDSRPASMEFDDWQFIQGSMSFIAARLMSGQNVSACEAIERIGQWQRQNLGDLAPSEAVLMAEKAYNRLSRTIVAAIAVVVSGALLLFCSVRALARGHRQSRLVRWCLTAVALAGSLYVVALMTLRGITGHYFPVSNGHETMLLMSAVSLIAAAVMRRHSVGASAAILIAGLALVVASITEKNPMVTKLMPVLQSPLLSVHVMSVMISYALFGAMAVIGVSALCLKGNRRAVGSLTLTSRGMLYPAVFCLTAGIFTGAVWANLSWGRYWGWDPKETWALVTLLIYALPLHNYSISWFKNPSHYHRYIAIAFISVIITYFGVNYFMAGLHSYATS